MSREEWRLPCEPPEDGEWVLLRLVGTMKKYYATTYHESLNTFLGVQDNSNIDAWKSIEEETSGGCVDE